MRINKIAFVIIFLSVTFFKAKAQDEPKYEMRSTWIATVANIDWPKYELRNKPDEQKAELQRMFDLYKATNLNTVFLQVRTECDAFYNSAYEPWSRYLTFTQGEYPGYDPLAFALEEAHKRGIELHVWMNPYRINASTSDGGDYYHSTHIYKEHPEWAMVYDSGKKILNPGRPEVMSYIGSVVRDLISNYEVDGVHFDDYFYAYEGTPTSLDDTEYNLYANGMSRGDWRRDNVNRMIDTVYKVIQEENPAIRFGVSPFGIYKNGVPAGIYGMDAYSQIYCDPLAWLEAGSVDYLTPQLYWPTGGSQDFETLTNWWADQCFANNRHLYTGHGIYRFSNDPDESKSKNVLHESKYYFDADYMNLQSADNLSMAEQKSKDTGDPVATWTLSQIGKQIDIVRLNQSKNGLGSVYYNASAFDRVTGLADYIVLNKYTHPTIVPTMSWKTDDTPVNIENLRSESTAEGDFLTWDHVGGNNVRYAIYMTNDISDSSMIILNQNNLAKIIFEKQVSFSELEFAKGLSIVVTAVSPSGYESLASSIYTLDIDLPMVELVSPISNDSIDLSSKLKWSCNCSNAQFLVQISTSSNFGNMVFQSPWQTDSTLLINEIDFNGETEYFWRVRAKTDFEGPFSNGWVFITGFPEDPELLEPSNLSQNVSTKPLIKWQASSMSDQIKVLVSEQSSFETIVVEEIFDAALNQAKLQTELEKDKWYYIKLQAINSYGLSNYSGFNTFKTTNGEIPDVYAILPEDGATVASFDYFKWGTNTTEGTINYQLEIAIDNEFTSILINSGWISETSLKVYDIKLEGGRSYYWRVNAKSEFGEGDYSQVRGLTTGYPSRPSLKLPANLSENVNVQPVIEWTVDAITDSVYCEFSEQNEFESIRAKERFSANESSGKLTSSLKGETWYYLHIAAENEYGTGVFSSSKYFKTGLGNSITEIDNSGMQVKLLPNRIYDGNFNIQILTANRTTASIKIYDVLGNYISSIEESVELLSGENSISVNTDILRGKGLYFIVIESESRNISKPLLVY